MSLKNDVYQVVIDHLKKQVPDLQEVLRDNNQIENEAQEFPYKYPMALVRFGTTEWGSYTWNMQLGDSIFTVRIGFEELTDDDSAVEDLAEKVNAQMHGFAILGFGTQWVAPFERISDRPGGIVTIQGANGGHNRVQIYEITYHTKLQDTSAYEALINSGDEATGVQLTIQATDLVIGSNTFRTQT